MQPWNTAGSAAALVEREGAGRGNARPGGRPQTGRPPGKHPILPNLLSGADIFNGAKRNVWIAQNLIKTH